ncbi:MAG: AbrB/MazE/SpoVT family DNA-binding domain-containing protein [Campylobacterota bacterium]|nr:AbrB/MazE/SpoVT family DNA-binding domain-containing protein [Campylobacterota bacterium]
MSTLIAIGNSQGIRIPKPFIKQAKLENRELELVVVENGLLIQRVQKTTRESWVEDIEQVMMTGKNQRDEALLDELMNDSDLEVYEW